MSGVGLGPASGLTKLGSEHRAPPPTRRHTNPEAAQSSSTKASFRHRTKTSPRHVPARVTSPQPTAFEVQ
jgi:hypothetical protein